MNFRRSYFYRIALISILVISFSVSFVKTYGFEDATKFENNRAALIGVMLKQHLENEHFIHKKFDNSLSSATFALFLKQLDVQKRFLLKEDVEKLKAYSGIINDELDTGKMDLAETGSQILEKRVSHVQQMVKEILSKDFDFSERESIETDVEKLDYCDTEPALRERWRQTLKYQVLQQYLNLQEDSAATTEKSSGKIEEKKPAPENLQETARGKIAKTYDVFFSRMLHETEREHFDRFLEAVARSFDPHTEYLPPVNKEDFDISMRGSLEGIGATLKEDDSYIKVVSIVPGGPAFLQGQLHAEDIILKVAEGDHEPVDITNMGVKDAVRLIRGKKGTEVRLTVKKPDGTYAVIAIVRNVVQLEDAFAKGMTIRDEKSGKSFGYIKIPTFYRDFEKTKHGGEGRNSTDDVKAELKKFESQDISGLVLDLRNNGGGALTDAVKIAGLFIKTGPIVQVKNGDGKIAVLSDDDPEVQYSGPVIVLVNKFSASASEILAGALQDYGRAIIMGSDHTHGKGTVQSMLDLNERMIFKNADKYKPLGALRLTIQKFYRISGASTQYRGITPDIELPDKLKGIKSGEQYLEYALPWDTVSPTQYTKWSDLSTDIPMLREKSRQRVMSKQDFIDIEAESRRIIEQQKKTLQSMNIDDARKERAENRRNKDKDGKNPHGQTGHEKKSSGTEMTEEEKKALWTKEVNEDAYIKESVSVLNDIIALHPRISIN